jgi:diaminopimelate decarboxylase
MCDADRIREEAGSILAHCTPELDTGELKTLLDRIIERRSVFLALREKHGSPLYVIEEEILADRATRFAAAFRNVLPDIRVYYALKSNNNPLVAEILVRNGLGLDVSSGLELQTALDCGAKDIVFSGPGKTEVEIAVAVEHRHRVTVLMDSFAELNGLQMAAAAAGVSVRAGIRVTTGSQGIWRKFGIPLEDLARFFLEAEERNRVEVRGVQFHVSWNMDPSRYVEFLKTLGAVLGTLPGEHLSNIEFIDIGGGFWPSQGEWLQEAGTPEGRILHAVSPPPNPSLRHFRFPAADIDEFASAIGCAVDRYISPLVRCCICLEPGRWLCNDAMHILMTVLDKKADDMVITDAGTNAVGGERFEMDYFPVINLTRFDSVERACLVMGSLCTPHDIWGYSCFGDGIEPGDVLVVPNQGAYTYSLRQHFIKPLPETVCIRTRLSERTDGF